MYNGNNSGFSSVGRVVDCKSIGRRFEPDKPEICINPFICIYFVTTSGNKIILKFMRNSKVYYTLEIRH